MLIERSDSGVSLKLTIEALELVAADAKWFRYRTRTGIPRRKKK
jgi:hypothetical protein